MRRSHRRAFFWAAVAGMTVVAPAALGAAINRFPAATGRFGLQRLRTLAYGVPPAS